MAAEGMDFIEKSIFQSKNHLYLKKFGTFSAILTLWLLAQKSTKFELNYCYGCVCDYFGYICSNYFEGRICEKYGFFNKYFRQNGTKQTNFS